MYDRVLVCWDYLVSWQEEEMIENAVRSCRRYFSGIDFSVVGRSAWASDGETTATTIMRRAYHRNGQADVFKIADWVNEARDAEMGRYYVVIFTGQDLNTFFMGYNTDYCFGASIDGVIVESVLRFREFIDYEEEMCIARILRHELGHLFGAAEGRNLDCEDKLFWNHCSNENCSMRQTLKNLDVLKMAYNESEEWPFCPACTNDLRKRLRNVRA